MTSMRSNVVITSLGALTPVGPAVEQSCAAIQAGISRITEHAFYECIPDDPEWDEYLPLFSSSVPTLDPFLDGFDRLLELTIPALTEVVENASLKRSDIPRAGLFIALPQSDAATYNIGLASNFIPQLCKRTGLTGFKTSSINQSGHTGIFEHVIDAITLLESGELDFCIIGGIDSYLLEQRLDLLDAAWRIRSERNVDGFIPGEAAVMIMLETEQHAKDRGMVPLSKIKSVASGQEPETITSQKTSTGSGLSDAITGVLQHTNADSFQTVYCSLNGESYYAFEWGIQLTRLSKVFGNMTDLIHPAENCGDVGAATGALLLACASQAFKLGYNAGEEMLLWTSANNGLRVALTLSHGEK
ncbi:MAG: hypothetical protein OEY89_08195 [Gammaproteobacteria bacterium]|nr:hypothetical protein [Gammaproteobacteria bacterium]